MYEVLSLRFLDMATYFEEKGQSVDNHKHVRQLRIASELARRLSGDEAFVQSHYGAPEIGLVTRENKNGYIHVHIECNEPRARITARSRKEMELMKFYLQYLTKLMNKYSLEWWD